MSSTLLGLIILLVVSWWLGWRLYLHLWGYQHKQFKRCPHCNQPYRGSLTYCPRCGEVVAQWSNRR
jgi:ribosomal protein S27AE